MKVPRVLASLAVAGVVIAAVCYIPLPHHIDCAFEVQPSRAGSVYAGTAGRIESTVEPGTRVDVGDAIAVLDNPDLEIRLANLRGEEEVAKVQLSSLRYRSSDDRVLKSQIETQVELLESIRSLRAKTEEEVERLTVRAERAGLVIPPPTRKPKEGGDGRLPSWTGTPLEEKNRGAALTADDLICEIGTPDEFEAVLVIDQGDMQLVHLGQVVDLKLDSRRQETFHGKVTEKSRQELKSASTSLSSQTGGDLQTEVDPETGQIKPRSVSYQARVPLQIDDVPLRPGYRGSAKVHVEPMSLGSRLWRLIVKTFNFDL